MDVNDLNQSALDRALSSRSLRDLAISICGAANGLTLSSFLMLGLANVAGPYIPRFSPDVQGAVGAMSLAFGIGIASLLVAVVPRPWRWVALLGASTVQFLVALSALPSLF